MYGVVQSHDNTLAEESDKVWYDESSHEVVQMYETIDEYIAQIICSCPEAINSHWKVKENESLQGIWVKWK